MSVRRIRRRGQLLQHCSTLCKALLGARVEFTPLPNGHLVARLLVGGKSR